MEVTAEPEQLRARCRGCSMEWNFVLESELSIELAKSAIYVHMKQEGHSVVVWERYRMAPK